ncbi:MAG TPA: hypothetical protein DEP05_07955 [Betaproteobacteria bacterium]|nr:hypothetical protein [Betaproteobacteria bacterium]
MIGNEQPIFRNAEHALRWAYLTRAMPIVARTQLSALAYGGSQGGATGLNGYERHAQAALIFSLAERVLNPLENAYLTVQYGRDSAGIDALVAYLVGQLGSGAYYRRGVAKLVRAYCGERIGISAIRYDLACRKTTALDLRKQAFDMLDVLHHKTIAVLEQAMILHQLLDSRPEPL